MVLLIFCYGGKGRERETRVHALSCSLNKDLGVRCSKAEFVNLFPTENYSLVMFDQHDFSQHPNRN